jgi:hypothetical protein
VVVERDASKALERAEESTTRWSQRVVAIGGVRAEPDQRLWLSLSESEPRPQDGWVRLGQDASDFKRRGRRACCANYQLPWKGQFRSTAAVSTGLPGRLKPTSDFE